MTDHLSADVRRQAADMRPETWNSYPAQSRLGFAIETDCRRGVARKPPDHYILLKLV